MAASKVSTVDTAGLSARIGRVTDNIETVIRGKRETVQLAVLAFISGGHLLIEDVPGVGKTMLARTLAKSVSGTFKRIQFTPDLLPSDVTGVSLFNQKTTEFEFSKGPVFANIVLADEINRTTPRTQSSLLEAMEEHQVSVDGVSYPLPRPFFVIATQNPVEYHGTYPLPEGQLDRFMMSIELGYPEADSEKEILAGQMIAHPIESVAPVVTSEEVAALQAGVRAVHIDESLLEYILEIVVATRSREELVMGASPRGTLALTRVAQASALMQGRGYVVPDDIKAVAPSTLGHRLLLKPNLRIGRSPGKRIVETILGETAVPVER